jgi:hypothetical protein
MVSAFGVRIAFMKLIVRITWVLIIMFVLAGTFDGDADSRLPAPQTAWGIFFLTVAGLLIFAHLITAAIDARNDRRH